MTTALEGIEGFSITPRTLFTPGKDPVAIVQRLGGPQGRSGQVRITSPPPGFNPRTVQPVASCYTDWATRPKVSFTCILIRLFIQIVTVSSRSARGQLNLI